MFGGEIAQLAVGVNDRAFVGSDGVSSVLEGGADVVDSRLAILHVKRSGFEEDVGLGGRKPVADIVYLSIPPGARQFAGEGARSTDFVCIDSIWIGDPAAPARSDSGNAVRDPVTFAEFGGTIFEKPHQCAVHIAEAEKAEIVGSDC